MQSVRTAIVLLIMLSCTTISATGQIKSVTKVFILRHADKAGEDLSPAGQVRASELKRILKETKIDSIFSTDVPRTKHTAEVLAQSLGLPVIVYNKEDVVISRVLKTCEGKRVLIVGHSNTVSSLITKCGCTAPASINPNIPDTQFDNLFLVLVSKKLKTKLCEVIHMKYGVETP
jgi:2,3-bisphosphoglycerate-dependent phosphoglycerate mutase